MPSSRADNDPFAMLGLPRRFDVGAAELQAAWLRRAAALHPDRFSDPIQQAEAARQAAALNDAKSILADDERRADALLRLLGGPAKEDNKSLPDGFLIDMMEVRQRMDDILAADDPAARADLESWARTQRHRYTTIVGDLFASGGEQPSRESLDAIRVLLNAWRYIERMIEQLDPAYRAAID